jgi:hypothetical protein
MDRRHLRRTGLVTLCVAFVVAVGAPAAATECGFLAVGVPEENIGEISNGGAVNVLYGQRGWGLEDDNNQFWDPTHPDLLATNNGGECFGTTLAVGDFNGDSFYDLAVGVPGQEVGGQYKAGAVQVIYNSVSGLVGTNANLLHQNALGVEDAAEDNDSFGSSLATGDFNGDGYDDLAVGVPGEKIGDYNTAAGAVNVFYGSTAGIITAGDQFFTQEEVGEESEDHDRFATALAVGDFNGDGYDDLAIGTPQEDYPTANEPDSGKVHVLYGSASGLTTAGHQEWTQEVAGIEESRDDYDRFGWALTTGDFNGDGYDDLAVGVPGEGVTSTSPSANQGAVNVIYGSNQGLSAAYDQLWSQFTATIEGDPEFEDLFGWALASGDFNGDGFDDLAVGVPGEAVDDEFGVPQTRAGAVNVLYGASGSGLSASNNKLWSQDSQMIDNDADFNDQFGSALAVGNFDCDAYDDLAIGVWSESGGTGVPDAGAVHVIFGSVDGLDNFWNIDEFWHQDVGTVIGMRETLDKFGFALAATPITSLFADGFEAGNTGKWSSVSP